MDEKVSKLMFDIVKRCFKHFNVPQQKNLADLLVAFLHNKSFALWDIASGLSGDTSVKHKHKRLKYFLDNLEIDIRFWKSFVMTVFSLPGFKLRKRKFITLAIDATTLRDDFWLLAVSVSYKGRSIPVLLKGWEGVNVHYDFWQRVEETLTDLKQILPNNYNYEIVADRGFQGEPLFKMCRKLKMNYIVRVNDCYSIKMPGGKELIQLSLFQDGFYSPEYIGRVKKNKGLHLCVNSAKTKTGDEAKWFLVTNREMSQHEAVKSYTTRFWIEESFKDLKSKLYWEKYTKKIPEKNRLVKSVIVSCLSYAIQLALGNQLKMSDSEKKTTSIFNKLRQTIKRGSKELEEVIIKFTNIIGVYIARVAHLFV